MSKKNKKQNYKNPLTKHTANTLLHNNNSLLNQYANQKQIIAKLGLQKFFYTLSLYSSRQAQTYTPPSTQQTNNNDHILAHILSIPSYHKIQSLIESLEHYTLPQLPKISILDNEILALAKNATLRMYDIFQFMQITSFFHKCSKHDGIKEGYLHEYFKKFVFPQEIINLAHNFNCDKKHEKHVGWHKDYLKESADEELFSYYNALAIKSKEKQEMLYKTLHSANLRDYLVDEQIHFFENNFALLVRAGYSNVLHARVVGRSTHGFFYIIPSHIDSIESQIHALHDKIQERLFLLEKEYSKILLRHIHFLRFINTEYDFIDKALARVSFAKDHNLEFAFTTQEETHNNTIVLHGYAHPSLKNPKPFNVAFAKHLLMITGVNAGGKTMLLKSILSALFCAKFCIPMRINPAKSKLPFIKNIHVIAQDPQDSHNDISTFSGRIKEFSTFLDTKNLILGIDEIEIGTDANEAASLYKVLLEKLLSNQAKIIVTTHHKHLAALMADNKETQLLAALYDYKNALPTFEFIDGVGKSYAMECAKYYGIPNDLIARAKEIYGNEANRLEKLIEESNYQITRNKQDSLKLQRLIAKQEEENIALENAKKHLKEEFQKQSLELKRHYNEAIKEIKMLAKQSQKNLQTLNDSKDLQGTQEIVKNIHKLLNKTHNKESKTPQITITSQTHYKVGDWVKHYGKFAKVLEITKNGYTIETNNGIKLRGINPLNLSHTQPPQTPTKGYSLDAHVSVKTKLDLHGLTREEALEELELMINQAIIAQLKEIVIIHGLGNGILKKTVEDFLDSCKYIRGYVQAPQRLGGYSAKVVYLL